MHEKPAIELRAKWVPPVIAALARGPFKWQFWDVFLLNQSNYETVHHPNIDLKTRSPDNRDNIRIPFFTFTTKTYIVGIE